jgi:hypothetical protein
MSHTPGPWDLKIAPVDASDIYWDERSEHDGPVRTIEARGEMLLVSQRFYPSTPENLDDWKLIAAAPDLLAALKTIVEEGYAAQTMLRAAEAAIAKAEGR